jgi:uncharacterized protein YjdB
MQTSNAERQSKRSVRRGWGLRALAIGALAALGALALLAATPAGAQVSTDASLSGLELSRYAGAQQPAPVIALRPAFDSATLSYGASATATSQVRLRATASQSGATITVDGQAVSSGAYSQALSLRSNEPKRIEVRVTAADGTTQRVYAVTATNNPQADLRDLSLSPVELHPSVFVTSQQAYRAWAAHSVESVRVTATRRWGAETLTVNGKPATSGEASEAIALEPGANLITVTATAPDQYTTKSYTITVTRATAAQSSDATLSGISVWTATSNQPNNNNEVLYTGDALSLTPAVTSAGREYAGTQPDSNGAYVAVAAATNAPGAKSIVVSGPRVGGETREPKAEVVSGEASGPWQLTLGARLVTITVTSLDGTNTQTYRLILNYGGVSDPSGLRLTAADGSLTLHWGADQTSTAPTHYQLRWRKAGETTWLNPAALSQFKTSYASGAPQATAAEGGQITEAATGRVELSGLENGVEYEVQARTVRMDYLDLDVMNWLRSGWQSLKGTPGVAKTALAITPTSPSREYGGVDDLSYTVSGLDAGDAAADVVTGALGRAAGDDAGSYAINMGTLAVATAYAGKYELPAAPTATTYQITARPIPSVSGVTVETRDEDGTTTATFDTTAAEGTDVLPGELAGFRAGGLVVRGSFPTAAAGAHNLAVTYALRDQGSFKASNYSLTQTSATLQGELIAVEVQPACRPAVGGDYDRDDDGLIEVCSLDQLNAIRFDSNGDGRPERGVLHEYTRAFPGIVEYGPGCPTSCQGYELVVDLDFDTNGNGRADAGDRFWNDGEGWESIHLLNIFFAGTFEGNGYRISNLYMNKPMKRWGLGLFAKLSSGGVIRNLHLENIRILGGCDAIGGLVGTIDRGGLVQNVHVTGELRPWPNAGYDVGMLAGRNYGRVEDSSASGVVVADRMVGILVGRNSGVILRSSAAGSVSGRHYVGGLVGRNRKIASDDRALVRSSTATADVTGTVVYDPHLDRMTGWAIGGLVGGNHNDIWTSMSGSTVTGKGSAMGGLVGRNSGSVIASYARGQVSTTGQYIGGLIGTNSGLVRASYSTAYVAPGVVGAGGLIGNNGGGARVQFSYWDTDVTGLRVSAAGTGMTSAALFTPTDYTGIYEQWNLDLNGDGRGDEPWQFSLDGDAYPILRPLGFADVESASVGIALTADAVPAQPTANDLLLTSITPPGTVTISPAFDSAVSKFTITLPPHMAEVNLYGRFDATGTGTAYLAVAPDLSNFDVFDAESVDKHLLAQLSGAHSGTYSVELDHGESQTLQVGVFKWKPDEVNQEPFSDHSLKRIYTITLTRAEYPTDDATLSNLVVTPGAFAFSPEVVNYQVDVASTVSSVTVTPRTSDPEATVTVADGQPGQPVQLEPGSNLIEIVVTARDGTTTKTYSLTVQRALDMKMRIKVVVDVTKVTADDMRITGLALPQGFSITPAFSPDHFEYQVSAPLIWNKLEVVGRFTTPWTFQRDSASCRTTALLFTSPSLEETQRIYNDNIRDPRDPATLLGMIDTLHNDPRFGRDYTLIPGQPTNIAVTIAKWKPCKLSQRPAQENWTNTTYNFLVTRALPPDEDASLHSLSTSAGPVELQDEQTAYTMMVGHSVTSLTLTPTPMHPSATVTVNGATADTAVELVYGTNLIQIEVTAADGTTTDRYTLTVNRARPDSPPQLSTFDNDEYGPGYINLRWQRGGSANIPIDVYELRVRNNATEAVQTYQLTADDLGLANGVYSYVLNTGLVNGVAYTVAMRTVNDGGNSAWLEQVVTMPFPNELRDLTINQELDSGGIGRLIRSYHHSGSPYTYQDSIAAQYRRVRITPEAFHGQATVTINGKRVTDHTIVDLAVGPNTITVVVSAPGSKSRTYTLTLTRETPPPPSSPLEWEIETTENSLTARWLPSTGSTPEVDSWDVELIGPDGARQTSSGPFKSSGAKLSHGFSNLLGGLSYTFRIRGTNLGGTGDWATSRVTLPLLASLEDISLRALTRAGRSGDFTAQLEQSFMPGRTSYTVSLPKQVIGLRITPFATSPKTVTINGKDAASNSNRYVTLRRGRTVDVKIVVTEGSMTRTYTFSVSVAGDDDAPTVASAISDQEGFGPEDTREVSLTGVFTDPNLDPLKITAMSSDTAIARVTLADDQSKLTLTGKKAGTATITVTADDGNGGTVSDMFTVTVSANAAPRVAWGLRDVDLNEGATYMVALRTVFRDANNDVLTITAKSSNTAIAPVWMARNYLSLSVFARKAGTATVTVTADDGNGGTVDETFVVTIAGNEAPTVASSISDVASLRADDTREVSLSGVFTDAENDSLTITAKSSDTAVATVSLATDQSSLTVTAKKVGTATITVTADDGKGGTVDDTFTVTVKANAAPTVASSIADVGGLRADDTRQVSLTGVFTDEDNDTLTITAKSSDTAVATVSVASDQSSLTVTAVKVGTATITVSAADGKGGTVDDTFTVTIGANAAPTVASSIADVGGLRADDTRQVSLTGVFTDADNDSLTITAKSSDTAVATVSVATDQSSLTVTAKKVGTATVTVTAADGEGGTVDDTFTVTVKVNSPPEVASAIADVSGLRADDTREISLTGVFTDEDGDALTITAKSSDTAVATVSIASDQSSLTVTAKQDGTATITVTAADGEGASGIDSFTVTVAANAPAKRTRTLDQVSGLRADDTREVSLTGVFTDADGDALTITAKSSDTAVATVSVATDQSSLTVTAKQAGTATITVSASDGNGGTASGTFTVTVKANSAPTVASAIADVSGVEPDDTRAVALSGVFTDADKDALTITAKSSDTAVATVTVATDQSSLTVTARQAGTATITVTAADGRGGSVSDVFTTTVSPSSNKAPTVASPLSDQGELREGDTREVSLTGVFTDAEGDALTLSASSSSDAVATATVNGERLTVTGRGGGTATITVTAADGKGGSVSDSFTVPVKRNAVPTQLAPLGELSGLAEQTQRQVSLRNAFKDAENDRLTITARSSDTGVATVAVAGDHASLTVRGVSAGTATITVTADDGRGGRADNTFRVTVESAAAQPDPEPEVDAPGSEPDPAPAEEQDVLVRFDVNGDGVISRTEYYSAFAHLGNGVTMDDLTRLRQAWADGGFQD